ncbi:hypothetical protein GQ457_01G030380 [Hibiscus cannabinus]
MSQSIDKPPYFNGAHYSHWKNIMMVFMQSVDYILWDIIEDMSSIPMKRVREIQVPKEMHERRNQERKQVQVNAKAMHILLCALGLEEHAKVSSCDNAKEIWDTLEVIHEGTNEVKETKISLLNLNYENFKIDTNKDIKTMFNRFSIIVNELKGFGEEIPEDKLQDQYGNLVPGLYEFDAVFVEDDTNLLIPVTDVSRTVSKPSVAKATVTLIKGTPMSSSAIHRIEFISVLLLGLMIVFFTCKCVILLVREKKSQKF